MADIVAAVTAARVTARARSRRSRAGRKRDKAPSYRYEFLADPDTATDGEPEANRSAQPSSSEQGTSTLGFAGVASVSTHTSAAGMVQHARDGAGMSAPMLPASWQCNSDHTRE
ncbi:PPW family C-terminal domain-containing PPE protein [Mycolicibacterium conceptionense]